MVEEIYPNVAKVKPTGENILKTWHLYLTPKELAKESFDVWRKSLGHNKTMLEKDFLYLGVGIYSDGMSICATTEFGE